METIAVIFDDGEGEMEWPVPVARVGPKLFRVEEHPDFLDHVVEFGDVFEVTASGNSFRFVRVVEKSPFKRLAFTIGREVVSSPALRHVFTKVEALGGRWDFMINFLFVYLPKECGYDPTTEIQLVIASFS